MKEIKARPLDENNKEGKMTSYIFFFQPFFALAMAIFIISFNKEVFKNNLAAQLFMGVFFLLVISSFFTNMPYNLAHNLSQCICYVTQKSYVFLFSIWYWLEFPTSSGSARTRTPNRKRTNLLY